MGKEKEQARYFIDEVPVFCAYDEIVNTDNIKPNPKNPNMHPDEQIRLLADVILKTGVRAPITVSKLSGLIVKGHGRLEAAKVAGLKEFPVEFQHFKDEEEEMSALLADNKIAELAEIDNEKLKEIFNEYDFEDLSLTGYSQNEFDDLTEIFEETTLLGDPDEVPEEVETRCKLGDIWQLGNHRLMCGDSTSKSDVEKLMDGDKADMVFTDPPYNVDYSNAERPKAGKTDFGKIKNDKMDDESFLDFLVKVYKNLDLSTKDNASFYIWYASNETIPFYKALLETTIQLNQQIIWKKPMLLGRGKYQWAHEPCIFAIKGSPYFTDDRTKTTVWDFGGYDKSKNQHPTQKPLFLPTEGISNSSNKGDLVLDLFGGSGSTLIACEQLNRKCYTMELDPHYVDVIITRWENLTGKKAALCS